MVRGNQPPSARPAATGFLVRPSGTPLQSCQTIASGSFLQSDISRRSRMTTRKAFDRIYRTALLASSFIAFVGSLLFESRPLFPVWPSGWLCVAFAILGVAVLWRAHRRKHYLRWEFSALTACAAVLTGFFLLQAVVHLVAGGQTYFLRPLSGIPFIVVLWLGEKNGYWFRK